MLDITKRKEAEEQIAFLAYHDKLTGLPNRVLFDELLELSLARARRHGLGVSVISVDIDNFKLVNDSLGHEAGDELIVLVAERLREATRETDLVARPGGDEFLMLLADLELGRRPFPGRSRAVRGRVRRVEDPGRRCGNRSRSPGTELYVTASLGHQPLPEARATTPRTLLKHADNAMFRSKQIGPGGSFLHAASDVDAMGRLSLSTRLRKAVENQSWMLHYQPLIDLSTGGMIGVEALIRWPEPGGGLIQPGEFIPLAEEMGLIEAIGDWVVEELSRQDALWRADGLTLEISFNLSPRQLWQPDVVDKVISRLQPAGMDPARLTVEITESTAMTDPERTQAILEDMHDRGLHLAIDDFGTGYSSLARLKHMPFDVLKIDRSFIRDVDTDRDAASMVSAMIALAQNLGMTALAEGIETKDEWECAGRSRLRARDRATTSPGRSRPPRSSRCIGERRSRSSRAARSLTTAPASAALRPSQARSPSATRTAEHEPGRRDLHALLLELLVQVQARRHPADVALLIRRDERDAHARPRPARAVRPTRCT